MKYKDLSSEIIMEKQKEYGKNVLPEEKPASGLMLFLSQFKNPLVYALCFAGIISLFLGKYFDIALIFSVVLINAITGFVQEKKTQKTLLALKKLIKPEAKVSRDGKKQKILASELVPGDIVFLGAGDRVPADGKILEAASFFINEAILTGESEAQEKRKDSNAFMGTIVLSGRAVMSVEDIGKNTKIGQIAETLRETQEPETTLQTRLKKLTFSLVLFSVFLSILILATGSLLGRNILDMIELSAVILVAIIPEALLMVITLVLVLAMRDSLKKKALIRKILAVETLGSVTTICSDKTGTLTEGIMRVVESSFKNEEKSKLIMCLCNDINDTVEIALWDYLKTMGNFDPQETFDKYERISEFPFSSEHKFMATVNYIPEADEKYFMFVKGAPEVVLSLCSVTASKKKEIAEKINLWAEKGLKVLALASKKVSKAKSGDITKDSIVKLEWEGMVGLWDPPRKEVKESLLIAKKAGLKIKVVTGDYHKTTEKVMGYLGIKVKPNEILDGSEIEGMPDDELRRVVPGIVIFSRVAPSQKLKIVNILQDSGEIIAMVGDGVNDAPALKKSNIGIVVGDASEVAKETADLILLDNNFSTIVAAVESGRLVFENIKKIILFILSNSFAEVVVILGALIMHWPFPLTVVQILWMHILCDGPEDFILGFEPKEKETMLEGPKSMQEPILDRLSIFLIVSISLLSGIFSLGFFWYFAIHQNNFELGRTMSFMSLAFSSVIYIFSCRTLRKPFWKYENFWSNKWLFGVVLFSLALAMFVTYFGPTQKLLDLVPLNLLQWSLLLAKGIILVAIIEVAKAVAIKTKKKQIISAFEM